MSASPVRYINPRDREAWLEASDSGELIRKPIVGWDDDKPKPGVRVCVYGYFNRRYDALAEITEANWAAYCARHGYACRHYPGAFTDTEDGDRMHDPALGENRFGLYYDLRGLFDIVMYLDIDSLFVNMQYPIDYFFDRSGGDINNPPTYNRRFLWTYDENGPNSSLLIARTDDTTERHLRFAYEYAKNNNNVRHDRIEHGGISDQDAMTALMNRPPFSHTFGSCYAASKVGIAYKESDVTPQTWIRSYAGMSLDEKLAAMKERAGV